MLEKCYIAAKLEEPISVKINKLQTVPLFSSVILQVKGTDINGSLHYLDFTCMCVCVYVYVCVHGGGGGGGGIF